VTSLITANTLTTPNILISENTVLVCYVSVKTHDFVKNSATKCQKQFDGKLTAFASRLSTGCRKSQDATKEALGSES